MDRRLLLALPAFLLLFPSALEASSLDISTEYRIRPIHYKNADLDPSTHDRHSIVSQRARLGFMLKNISLAENPGGEPTSMDVGIRLHAVGVAGSTSAFTHPFDRMAEAYPDARFVPFIENAYLDVRGLGGQPVEATFGRQSFRLGTGLLLDDNGAGLTGATVRYALPWWGLKTEGFFFGARNLQIGGPNNLDVFGASLELPAEGTWQLHQLVEKDRTPQQAAVNGCLPPNGCQVNRATRWFSSLRYQLNYGPIVFDGEAALQQGYARTVAGAGAPAGKITYNANAQLVRAKWKQTFYKDIRGIARVSMIRGSGDNSSTVTKDEAFFPSNGLRYDGIDRAGMGEFFGATPYDALAVSTATTSGLRQGSSGILGVGIGVTPPAYMGIVLDLDFYLFQADRNVGPHRSLGQEFDIRLRYDLGERLNLRATAAFFKAGAALDPSKGSARRYSLEASGRF